MTAPHPNLMTAWSEIGCQRGCGEHTSRRVEVSLGGPTGYHDYPLIPGRLARRFTMDVWDPDVSPVDGGLYCPARDVVSQTIIDQGVWEVCETIFTLLVCASDAPGIVVDAGSQIGWFSLLSASCGRTVLAVDADAENLSLLEVSARENGWQGHIEMVHERVTEASVVLPAIRPIRLAKIDVEGAESEVIRVLWPSIEAGLVDFLLIEVSPVFADWYGAMVDKIVAAGYDAFLLPDKQTPPARFDRLPDDLYPLPAAGLGAEVDTWRQQNLVLARKGVVW